MKTFTRYLNIGSLVEMFLMWDKESRNQGLSWAFEDATFEVWAGGLYLVINRVQGVETNGGVGAHQDNDGAGGVS